jgi:hypothetical protein
LLKEWANRNEFLTVATKFLEDNKWISARGNNQLERLILSFINDE